MKECELKYSIAIVWGSWFLVRNGHVHMVGVCTKLILPILKDCDTKWTCMIIEAGIAQVHYYHQEIFKWKKRIYCNGE